jgi:carnitine-CoA ligase
VDAVFPATIPELLEWRAARAGARPWLRFEGDTWSLDDVLREVDRFAVGLAERGVRSGDRVAMLLGNRPETLFAWFATNRVGAIAAPLNPAYKRAELQALARVIDPVLFVVDPAHRELAAAVADGGRKVATAADFVGAGAGAPRVRSLSDDVAVLVVTSGTTSVPKAVMQTHGTYLLTAEAFPWWTGLGEEDRLLTALPLFHINAQAYSVMGSLGCGAGLSILPRFSASRFWEEARRHEATEFNAVGAMISILQNAPSRKDDREHSLRLCYCALALPEERHRAFEERFGLRMMVGYGLSETTFGTVWPRSGAAPYGTMGALRQHPRLGTVNRSRVVTEDGRDAAIGEPGELWLDNPAMMKGYWDDPAATAAAFEGRFFRTGDLVRKDAHGVYTFVARKKDVIRRKGENVAATEIEAVLATHPDVFEAAAVGVPSALGEDDIVAYVVPRAGHSVDPDAVRAYVAERLAAFKVPTAIHIRSSLPRTPTERIAKHLLR